MKLPSRSTGSTSGRPSFSETARSSSPKAGAAKHSVTTGAITQAKTTVAAWRVKPTWYAVSTQDRTINPDLERYYAKRIGATTTEIKASHVPFLSHPKEVARVIEAAAK